MYQIDGHDVVEILETAHEDDSGKTFICLCADWKVRSTFIPEAELLKMEAVGFEMCPEEEEEAVYVSLPVGMEIPLEGSA